MVLVFAGAQLSALTLSHNKLRYMQACSSIAALWRNDLLRKPSTQGSYSIYDATVCY